MRCFKKVPDPQKVVKFTFLQKDALEIARNMQMNIDVYKRQVCGSFVMMLSMENRAIFLSG